MWAQLPLNPEGPKLATAMPANGPSHLTGTPGTKELVQKRHHLLKKRGGVRGGILSPSPPAPHSPLETLAGGNRPELRISANWRPHFMDGQPEAQRVPRLPLPMAVFKTTEDMEPPANPMAFRWSQVSLHWEWQQ